NQLPKSVNAPDQLTIAELFQYGKTIQYDQLPEVLWAATGIRIEKVQQYQEFGKLRNMIIHFAVPNVDYGEAAFKFLFEIMEPLVRQFWGETIVPYAAVWDEYVWEEDGLKAQLEQNGIDITPELAYVLDQENYTHARGVDHLVLKP